MAVKRLPVGVKPRQGDAQGKEENSQPDGGLDENLRSLRAPNRFGKPASESRAEAFLLAPLHEHDQAHEQRDDHIKKKQDIDGDVRPKHKRAMVALLPNGGKNF